MRVFCLCLLLAFGALPAMAQDITGPIATENTLAQDQAIATRMREIIDALGGYDDVEISVNDGVMTLRGTTTSAADAVALQPLATRIDGVVAVRNEVTETADIAQRLNPAVDRFAARLDRLLVILPLALIAALAFGLVVLAGFAIARLRQPWDRIAPNRFVADIYRQMIRVVFAVIGAVIALDILNATALLGTILGAAGIIGLAFGFAVRETVENFIASVMLSFKQPFRPNDTVEIDGDIGKVIRLTSRATILLSLDGNHIRIPNATVFKSRIVNYSTNPERRFRFTITVPSDSDLHHAVTLMNATVQALPFVLPEPKAESWIETVSPGGVEVTVTGWIDQKSTSLALARGEAMRQVKLAVTANAEKTDRPAEPLAKPATARETRQVEPVNADQDAALSRIVAAERNHDDVDDLLRPDSPKE